MKDYTFDSCGGCELSDDASGRTIYLQGEDADAIRDLDAWLEETDFPYGPYAYARDAIDAILDEYFACLE